VVTGHQSYQLSEEQGGAKTHNKLANWDRLLHPREHEVESTAQFSDL